jgi:mRNA interferase RelE/StbE
LTKFRIFETDRFMGDLKKDFSGYAAGIRAKLAEYVYPQLRSNPYFGPNIKKLRGYSPDTWRYRIGDYRFFYTINEKEGVVYMLTAEARKDSY